MRKVFVLGVISAAAVVGSAELAGAHNEFEPHEAAPGSIITLTLKVENERADSGTTRVELFFPDGTDISVVDVPAVAGWTASAESSPAPSQPDIVWQGGPANQDFELPLTLGPLPDTEGRLQFKVLQTYGDGEIDRWIQDWPAGGAEPEMPGPVIDLVQGAAGTLPPTTTAQPTTSRASSTTNAPATTSTTRTPATTGDDNDDSGTAATIAVITGIGAAALGALLLVRMRNRRASSS